MVLKRSICLLLLLLQHLVRIFGETLSGHHHPPHYSLDTDRTALLAFKKTISSDPYSTLANWNETNDVCSSFTGVRCNKKRHRVVQLILVDKGLEGLLSPFISNLTRLRHLEIVDNQLFGIIPPEFSFLRLIHSINLSLNNLHGPIPVSFSLLSKLHVIFLTGNNLTGKIPTSFFSNCTLLENVDISNNALTGKIPPGIGNCLSLWNLNLYSNQFTGEIPMSLSNASNLINLGLNYNHLSGELPSKILAKLSNILYIDLSYNNMSSPDGNTDLDPFFTALTNCTKLKELKVAGMGLGGRLPTSIGHLGVNLSILFLQENNITGSIPPKLAYLTNLTWLNMASNLLTGSISAQIGGLSKLERLSLSYNFFSGKIPAAMGRFPNLGLLDLSNNRLSREIPKSLGDLVRLNYLFLNNNFLSGTIPPSLCQCTGLSILDLSYNRLTGSIPPDITSLHEIRIFLNLSHNCLEGPLPIELSKLENVQEIDLSRNNLTGSIFLQISSCLALTVINLSYNSLTGKLPETLGNFKNLEAFDVSRNQLSGPIPISLNKVTTLTFMNLSFNNFVGMIPSGGIFNSVNSLSFLGNKHLCGSALGIPTCHKKRQYFHSPVFLIVFCIVISVSMFFSTICCVIGCRCLKVTISSGQTEREGESSLELIHNFPRITYKEITVATGGFNQQRLLGSGSYGRVYKGVLQDGTPVAVKVLHMQSGNSTKSFNRECQVLKRIRHRNLIRIITACSLPDFKALVLPYMANGSLDSRLYPHSGTNLALGSSDLSLIQRVNICSDIAEGMAYLHHHSPTRVIHCDLKPSNVLLNDDMTALVSDFGIARLVMTAGVGNAGVVENIGNSTANMLTGSIGYIAPEYGIGSKTSTKGDVYSFGILVLEMVTRKKPTDDMFVEGLTLHKWVKINYHRGMEKVVDSSLVRALRDQSPELKKIWAITIGELIELGILCTQEAPSTRPTMLDAADNLDHLKRYLNGDTTATFASSLISSSTLGYD